MKYTFDDLVEIVQKLRAPDGCPWDKEQTHDSIRENTVEEVYEMLEAFDSGNGEKMADESGDLLLHIVFHANIGKKDGKYDINDVTDAICRKLISRHPHIFGNENFANSDEVIQNWDQLKRNERGQSSVTEELKGVSKYLPSLMRAQKVQKKAAKAGFSIENRKNFGKYEKKVLQFCESSGTLDKISFLRLLFGMLSVADNLGIQLETALNSETDRFIAEFAEFETDKL